MRRAAVCSRSLVGEVVASPWDISSFGRLVTGEARWFDKGKQLKTWRDLVAGWERFIS
jgi:hypothetical protein